MSDPYRWIDPADAIFVQSCREQTAMDRRAWERCHAERLRLQSKLRKIRELLDAYEGAEGPRPGNPPLGER